MENASPKPLRRARKGPRCGAITALGASALADVPHFTPNPKGRRRSPQLQIITTSPRECDNLDSDPQPQIGATPFSPYVWLDPDLEAQPRIITTSSYECDNLDREPQLRIITTSPRECDNLDSDPKARNRIITTPPHQFDNLDWEPQPQIGENRLSPFSVVLPGSHIAWQIRGQDDQRRPLLFPWRSELRTFGVLAKCIRSAPALVARVAPVLLARCWGRSWISARRVRARRRGGMLRMLRGKLGNRSNGADGDGPRGIFVCRGQQHLCRAIARICPLRHLAGASRRALVG